MNPDRAERILTWSLRVLGVVAALAIVAVAMPTSWMVAGAEWSGVAPFPDTVLGQYLARTLSALYALFGVLVLYIARDVRGNLDLIRFVGWLTIALGLLLTTIDFGVGMPPSWSWGEGPPTIVIGGAIVWLARRARPGP